ncbi:MAG: tRNA (adenosine(37)-N6)-dimethylallyltransferase MiaA [Pseudomonadota bacterium]
MPHRRPILIAGPTASGKSALAVRLAEALGGTIINADALQVYSCWRVLTARPSPADEARAPHRLFGHVGLREPYSVGAWLRDAAALTDVPQIFVGGTGFYLTKLIHGLAPIPAIPKAVRTEGDALAVAGADAFRRYLSEHDPETMTRIDVNNPARLQRAWEVHRATGQALSDWQRATPPPLIDPMRALRLNVVSDPNWLRARIDARFDAMMASGALDEVRAQASDWDPSRPSAKALGAAELMAALDGDMALADAVAAAKTATHQYAKRQRTWFRSNMRDWHQLRSERLERDGLAEVLSLL